MSRRAASLRLLAALLVALAPCAAADAPAQLVGRLVGAADAAERERAAAALAERRSPAVRDALLTAAADRSLRDAARRALIEALKPYAAELDHARLRPLLDPRDRERGIYGSVLIDLVAPAALAPDDVRPILAPWGAADANDRRDLLLFADAALRRHRPDTPAGRVLVDFLLERAVDASPDPELDDIVVRVFVEHALPGAVELAPRALRREQKRPRGNPALLLAALQRISGVDHGWNRRLPATAPANVAAVEAALRWCAERIDDRPEYRLPRIAAPR